MGVPLIVAQSTVRTQSRQYISEPTKSDSELIVAVADGDADAFSELVSRYEPPAINLALRITGNRTLAQEAVQDGLARIWQGASSYEPGNARSWILRIIAREGFRVAMAEQKEKPEDLPELVRNPERFLKDWPEDRILRIHRKSILPGEQTVPQ